MGGGGGKELGKGLFSCVDEEDEGGDEGEDGTEEQEEETSVDEQDEEDEEEAKAKDAIMDWIFEDEDNEFFEEMRNNGFVSEEENFNIFTF